MLPYTGTFTQLGVAIDNGFRMALQEAGGKVGGREVEFFKVDDESEPSKGVENANKLVQRDKVDVLIEAERENEIEDGVNVKTHVKKLALRLKKNFELDDSWALFVRGLVGREWSTLENFNYSYVDTGIHYENGAFGLMAGLRFQRTLDGTAGHDRNKFRFGPSYEIDAHHEIELRFVRAWNVQTSKLDSDALIAEYTYKF